MVVNGASGGQKKVLCSLRTGITGYGELFNVGAELQSCERKEQELLSEQKRHSK